MTTTPDNVLTITPDEARAQADELERGVAETDALMSRILDARAESRSESASYDGEYAPDATFPSIQSPAQQTGVALMLRLAQRKEEWGSRAASLRKAIADLEAVDTENAENIDAIDTDLDTKEPTK